MAVLYIEMRLHISEIRLITLKGTDNPRTSNDLTNNREYSFLRVVSHRTEHGDVSGLELVPEGEAVRAAGQGRAVHDHLLSGLCS